MHNPPDLVFQVVLSFFTLYNPALYVALKDTPLKWQDLRLKLGDSTRTWHFIQTLKAKAVPYESVMQLKESLQGLTVGVIGIRSHAASFLLKWMLALVKYYDSLAKVGQS